MPGAKSDCSVSTTSSLRKWFMSHTPLAAPPEIYFSWRDFSQPFQSGSAKTPSLLQAFSKGLDNVYSMPRHQACDGKKVSVEQSKPFSTFWANSLAVQAPHCWKDLMFRLILFVSCAKPATNIQQFNKELEREKRQILVCFFTLDPSQSTERYLISGSDLQE